MKPLRWKRSQEQHAETHCGEFHIHPQYWGCVSARSFQLRRGQGHGEYVGTFDTHRDAKAKADELRRKST
jgi:hypothetical protein